MRLQAVCNKLLGVQAYKGLQHQKTMPAEPVTNSKSKMGGFITGFCCEIARVSLMRPHFVSHTSGGG